MPFREQLQRLGAGRAIYHLVHRPVGALRASFRAGGPIEQWRTIYGRDAMEAAARHLTPLPAVVTSEPPIELHLLTGRRFWYQTVFCLYTFARHAGRIVHPVIYDDGTLRAEDCEPLRRLFPAIRFVSASEAVALLDQSLPVARYPTLRDRWRHYPNLRKLIDPHLRGGGWKLVLDSDLLFFRCPHFLLQWLDAPDRPLHAVDTETSYGYPRSSLDALSAAPVADLVNVGLCGLKSDELDWERIEHLCRTLVERHGTHYYLEQALVALLVAGRPCAVAPAADYVTLPREPEANDCRAVMHHYVAASKRWYFRQNWRRALERARNPTAS